MNIRALVLSSLLLSCAMAQAQTDAATPQVVQGEVSGFDYRAYRFTATAGQYYHIVLDNPDVDFSLLPLKRGAKVPEGAEGYIPEDGEYEVRVLQKREAAQNGKTSAFQLQLTVNNGQSDAADAASYATNVHFTAGSVVAQYSGRLQGQAQDSFRFYGNAGQMLRVQASGENVIASLHYLGKGHDTLQTDGQILPTGGAYELRLALNRAAARRNKSVEYQIKITLEGRAPDAQAQAAPPAPAAPLETVAQDAAQAPAAPAPANNSAATGESFFITYRCADGKSHKVHYADVGSTPRATVYLDDAQYNVSWSKRRSTPAQAVLYGKGHYLVLNTPSVQRDSQILQFFKRNDEGEAVLAANCAPQ